MSVLFMDTEIKRDGSMRRSFSSRDAVRIILGAAPVYAGKMVGKIFLYVFEGRYIEVTYRAKEFKHLTGVSTKLSARDFYKLALSGKLTPEQVFFDSRHPAELCERKMRHLQRISDIVNSDIIVLEELGTASRVYKFGFTELGFTLCLDKDFDADGRPRSDYYIVHSLRDGDCFSKSLCQYECNFVFSKQNDRVLYDTLNFSDGKADVSCLPDEIKEKLAPELK